MSSDCPTLLRIDGATYTWAGFTKHATGSEEGTAQVSSCDDEGQDAQGAYFPANPEHTPYVTFPGLDSASVIGTRSDNGTISYFLSDRLDSGTTDQLRAQLKSQS